MFSGMTFYVPTSVDRYSELKRYITAYPQFTLGMIIVWFVCN